VADADEPGIVAQITTLIADRDIPIRQTISDDPEFTDDPKLYIITDEPLPGDLINRIVALPFVRKVELS
jgi:hypothetical protein